MYSSIDKNKVRCNKKNQLLKIFDLVDQQYFAVIESSGITLELKD